MVGDFLERLMRMCEVGNVSGERWSEFRVVLCHCAALNWSSPSSSSLDRAESLVLSSWARFIRRSVTAALRDAEESGDFGKTKIGSERWEWVPCYGLSKVEVDKASLDVARAEYLATDNGLWNEGIIPLVFWFWNAGKLVDIECTKSEDWFWEKVSCDCFLLSEDYTNRIVRHGSLTKHA